MLWGGLFGLFSVGLWLGVCLCLYVVLLVCEWWCGFVFVYVFMVVGCFCVFGVWFWFAVWITLWLFRGCVCCFCSFWCALAARGLSFACVGCCIVVICVLLRMDGWLLRLSCIGIIIGWLFT